MLHVSCETPSEFVTPSSCGHLAPCSCLLKSLKMQLPLKMGNSIIKTQTKDTTEAVVQRCSVKKVFLKISQNSQENTCARVYFLI